MRRVALANATAQAEVAVRRFYQPPGQEAQGAGQLQQQQWEGQQGEGELQTFYGALQVERIRGGWWGVWVVLGGGGGVASSPGPRGWGGGVGGNGRAARGWCGGG